MNNKKISIVLLIAVLIASAFVGCQSNNASKTNNETQNEETTQSEEVAETTEEVIENDFLVTAQYLSDHLNDDNLLILDARGDEAYAKGHIPGAVSISWPSFANVNGAPGDAGWGVVLDEASLSEKLSAIGVSADKTIVVYANTLNGWGEDGRIVWMLRMAGLENAKVLDGGINFWEENDFETTKEATVPVATEFVVESINSQVTINTEELTNRLGEFTILDTREQNEFDGDANYGEKRGGHLPNARLLTFNNVLNEDGTFKTTSELESIFEAAGLNKEDEIVTYCTAGIRSAHLQVALNMTGYNNVRNYDASFYEYAANEALPLESKIIVKGDYNYYSPEQVKLNIETKSPFILLDIQVEEEFDAHHINGALATYAYPVKSDEDKQKIDSLLETLEVSDQRIVVVCPRGGGGAERTVNYLLEKGILKDRLFILEEGQAGWPFEELLNN